MPKKLTILGALTAALVFGYLGLFNSTGSGAPLQTFATSGLNEISVDQCYDTVAGNYPTISGGRVVCNPGNPDPATTGLALSTNYTSWQIINLPLGNRLTLPTGFTPSGAGQWSNTAIACGPVDANNRCTAGTNVGNITSRTDIFCNQQIDILASGGPGGATGGWPNSATWTPPSFTRIAADVASGGNGQLAAADPDSYIHGAVSLPASWNFRSSDLSLLTLLYIDGTLPFPIPGGSKLNNVVYQSTYPGQAGLTVNQALLGGSPDNPPSDDVSLCLSSPQDSVSQVGYLVTPAANTIIPRWTLLQSDFDLGDHSLARILDWQCDRFGAGLPDADGDCDPDVSDSNDGNKDTDGDLVPDGVERSYNSNPLVADSDGDGANDYEEMFAFTRSDGGAGSTDTDGDGQADKVDNIPTNGANVPAGNNLSVAALNPDLTYDALDATDDNCPSDPNPTQLNTDSLWQYHGMGGNADPDGAGALLGQNTSTGDRTNPNEDVQGDACDTDDDNDAIPDLTEPLVRIAPWSGPVDTDGAGPLKTSVCVGVAYAGGVAPIRTLSTVLGDSDFDMVLDGRECQFRSRPDASCRTASVDAGCVATPEAMNCTAGAIVPSSPGCAQPAANATTPGGGDTDGDGLYMPGTAATHQPTEIFFRTMKISISIGVLNDDVDLDGANGDADADSDRDTVGATGTFAGLRDGVEVRFYNSNPITADSDSDGCRDGDEVTDMNGDGNQNPADSGLRQQATGSHDTAPNNGRMDTNLSNAQGVGRYALATNRDLNKDGQNNPADAGILAAAISATGTCSPYNETGPTSTSATKNLP